MTPLTPSRRILLADDDRELRLGVAELLSDLGLEVRHAEDGLEAIEVAQRELVHGALLDLFMPGCTGIEALPLLRRARRGMPCILYSGRWTPELEQTVLEAGAWAFLKKPVDPALLRSEVRRALGMLPGEAPGHVN